MLVVVSLFIVGLILLSCWYVNFRRTSNLGCRTLIIGIFVTLLAMISLSFVVSSHLGLIFISLIGLGVIFFICYGEEHE
jgi:hypothetical protein